MEEILREVQAAFEARLYYAALILSLTLPDICAALAAPDGRSHPDRYKAWFRDNLSATYKRMSEDDIYSLRSGVLHQGRLGHPGIQYGRVIFAIPRKGWEIHNNIAKDGLQLQLEIFCTDVIAAARRWFEANQNDANVQRNLPNLMRYRSEKEATLFGLPVAVIA